MNSGTTIGNGQQQSNWTRVAATGLGLAGAFTLGWLLAGGSEEERKRVLEGLAATGLATGFVLSAVAGVADQLSGDTAEVADQIGDTNAALVVGLGDVHAQLDLLTKAVNAAVDVALGAGTTGSNVTGIRDRSGEGR